MAKGKWTAAFCAAALLITASAGAVQAQEAETKQTLVSYTVSSEYVVEIPADTHIPYGEAEYPLGRVRAAKARIAPGEQIVVACEKNEFVHRQDAGQTIRYTLVDQTGRAFREFRTSGTDDYAELSVVIEPREWEQAMAGEYASAITFRISCETTD